MANGGFACSDTGWGFTENGELSNPRQPGDLRVLSLSTPPVPYCPPLNWADCHRDGYVGPTDDCGDLPTGTGGAVTPGVYVLTGYVLFGNTHMSPQPGGRVWQTLYVTSTSALLISDDTGNMSFLGSYTYTIEGNRISFAAVCEGREPLNRAFPGEATFTASGSILEFFDTTRKVRSTFQRIE